MKKLAYVVVGVVVLLVILVGAVFIAPGVIDWNGYKPDIAQAAREATGRELAIDGDIEVSLSGSLVLSFSAGGIRFANADGMTPPEMATIGSVSGTIRLWPLLGRAVVVDSLVVSEPVINLGVDGQGRANWVFAEKPAAAAKAGPTAVDEGLPFADLTLGDVRIEKGRVSYKDSASGQAIEASDIAVKVALAGLASPLTVDGAMVLNAEPVKLQLGVETPEGLMLGPEAKASLALETKHLTASYKGRVLRRPVDGLDGEFALDVPSVGRLAAWLDRPFPEDQPDPGPLKVRARFAGEGAKVALESATIEGEALKAKASGSYDGPGEVAQIVLDIDSEALDIDRYLPPPVKGQAKAAPKAKPTGKPENPLAALSDEPLDLSALKGTKADVKVRIAGVKAAGYNIGEVAFVAVLDGGVLTADLTKLALYGGQVTGTTKLDASGDALGLEAALAVAKVKVDALAKAATGEASVVGIASGTLEARSSGKSPRDLAQNMKGELAFKLGGVDVKKAPKGSISSLDVTLLLPGLEKQPKLDASVVYNKQKVSLSATTDPVQKLLQADRFAADLKLGSKLVNAGYSGMVQRRPVPGLDGKLDLEIGSVAKLARWLGQPLAKGQPDPGPLRVAAVMAAKGETVVLKEAKITGKALDAKASGSYDGSGKVKKVVLNLESGVLDIDRYLPPAAKAAKPAPQGGKAKAPTNPMAALSNEPLDLSGLKGTEADIKAKIAGIKAVGYRIGEFAFDATLKGGVLRADLSKLALYGGEIVGNLLLDGSGDALGVETSMKIADLKVDELARAATGGAALVGIASGTLEAQTTGKSARALAENVRGKLAFTLGGVDVKQAPAGAISGIELGLKLPGPKERLELAGSVVYNQEKVALSVATDPLQKVLESDRFAAELVLDSKLVQARYGGQIQQRPLPGLDGKFTLNVPSVGRLAGWLGQPLDKDQRDPGPIEMAAELTAKGDAVVLKQATIAGKAVQATASGSFTAAKPVPSFEVLVDVQQANLNAYLPPETKGRAARAGPAGPAGWDRTPIDFSGLRAANGQAIVKLSKVEYKNLVIDRGELRLRLDKGVMTTTVDKLGLAGGIVDAKATVEASGDVAKISYAASAEKVGARPVLIAFADTDRLSGTAYLLAKGETQGRSQFDFVNALNGDGNLQFLDGAIHGINLAAVLRKAKTLGFNKAAGETQKTDFAEITASYTVRNGLIENRDMKMLAPLVRLTGAGLVPMPPRQVDYKVEAKLVASIKGQGGKDSLAGLPIPIRITGSWDQPKYTVDWNSVFQEMARDPERLKNLPGDLKKTVEGLGIPLPLPGLDKGAATKPAEVLKGVLDSVGKKSGDGSKPSAEDAVNTLKGLFK